MPNRQGTVRVVVFASFNLGSSNSAAEDQRSRSLDLNFRSPLPDCKSARACGVTAIPPGMARLEKAISIRLVIRPDVVAEASERHNYPQVIRSNFYSDILH